MKKYLFSVLLSALTTPCWSQTIAITNVYGTSFCTETISDIGFKATGSFQADNIFEAQLSDSSGNFSASSTIIGNISASAAGDMDVIIFLTPAIVQGSKYNIRINSTDPAVNGIPNGPLTIYSPVAPLLSVSGKGCLRADSLTLTGAGSAHIINWFANSSTISDTSNVYKPSTVAGGNGSGNSSFQLNEPGGISLDKSGNLYVADINSARIQKFPAGSTSASSGTIVAGGNGQGDALNQLNVPSSVFVDGNGNVYVSDFGNDRIIKFLPGSNASDNGIIVAGGSGEGSGADQLDGPEAAYVDGSGNLYVADGVNNRIQKFPAGSTSGTHGITVAGGNGEGSAANQFDLPLSIYLDGDGNLYVVDADNFRVQKFGQGSTSATDGTTVAGGNGSGSAANQLRPLAVFVDGAGSLYVADDNNRIQKFPAGSTSATNGITVAGGNGAGSGAGQFNFDDGITGITFDGNGNIYVSDNNNNRVQMWHLAGVDSSYTPTASGSYSATFITGYGCSSPSSNIVQVHPATPPTIIRAGNELVASTSNSYQWLLNGEPGGNDQTINLSQNGDYSVIVIDSNGCSDTSQTLDITTLGISSVPEESTIKLYPNPNTGSFLLETSNSIGNEFMVYDIMGNMVMHQAIENDKQVVVLKGIAPGTYTLWVKGNPGKLVRFAVYE